MRFSRRPASRWRRRPRSDRVLVRLGSAGSARRSSAPTSDDPAVCAALQGRGRVVEGGARATRRPERRGDPSPVHGRVEPGAADHRGARHGPRRRDPRGARAKTSHAAWPRRYAATLDARDRVGGSAIPADRALGRHLLPHSRWPRSGRSLPGRVPREGARPDPRGRRRRRGIASAAVLRWWAVGGDARRQGGPLRDPRRARGASSPASSASSRTAAPTTCCGAVSPDPRSR